MIPRTPWSPGSAAWQDDLSPLPTSEWNNDRAAHLLAHAGFGGTPEEIEKLADAGLDRAVERLVQYEPRVRYARLSASACTSHQAHQPGCGTTRI